MSNLAKFSLNELEVDEIYVTDVLKCLLHTIVFQRCLGEITPSESECENLPDLHYPSAEIDAVNKEIDDSVKKFVDSLADVSKQIKQRILNDEQQQQASGNNNNNNSNNSSSNNRTKIYSAHQQFTIELGFYSVKKISYFLRTVEEKSDYEKWIIPLKILFYFDNHHTNNNTNTSTNNTLSTSSSSSTTTSNNNKNASIATPNTTTTANTTTTMTTITTNKRGSLEVNPHRFSRNRSSSFHKQSVSRLMESVEQRMKTIIIESHQKIDHLPIVKMDEIPKFFPFRITLPTLTKGGGLWTGSLMDLVGFN